MRTRPNERIGKLKEVNVFVPAGIRGNHFKPVPVPDGFNYIALLFYFRTQGGYKAVELARKQ